MILSFRCKYTQELFEGGDPRHFRAFKNVAVCKLMREKYGPPCESYAAVHPGEILREDFLFPLGMSVNALAIALDVPATRIHEIVKERRSITADTAQRLACYFGGDAASWLALQAMYDLKTLPTRAEILEKVVPRTLEPTT